MASLDEESCKKFNVAARWALRQYGVVRARCEEFDPQDLEGTQEEAMTDPDTGDKVIRVAADPFAGIKKLMTALEATVGKTALDRKGEPPIPLLSRNQTQPWRENLSIFARDSGPLQLSSSGKA